MLGPQIPMDFETFERKYDEAVFRGRLRPHLNTFYNALCDYVLYSSDLKFKTRLLQDTIEHVDKANQILSILLSKNIPRRIKQHTFLSERACHYITLAFQADLEKALFDILQPYWEEDNISDDGLYWIDQDGCPHEWTEEEINKVNYTHLPFLNVPLADVKVNAIWGLSEQIFMLLPYTEYTDNKWFDEDLTDERMHSISDSLKQVRLRARQSLNVYTKLPRYVFLVSLDKSCRLNKDSDTLRELYWGLKVFGLLEKKLLQKHARLPEKYEQQFWIEKMLRADFRYAKKLGLYDFE